MRSSPHRFAARHLTSFTTLPRSSSIRGSSTRPIKLYGPDDLAAKLKELGAEILICEADFCSGAVFDLPLKLIGATRGDPANVDVAGATAAGIPVVCTRRGATPMRWRR